MVLNMSKQQRKTAEIQSSGVTAYLAKHPDIKALQRKRSLPSIHGDRVWDSSFVLMDFLTQNPITKHQVMMDIGCGWGVLSCFLAKELEAQVLGVDADPAVEPYFLLHSKKNSVALDFVAAPMNVLKQDVLRHIDIVVGADICFWPELKTQWAALIKRCQQAGVKQIFLADPGREPFWNLETECKKLYGRGAVKLIEHKIKKPFRLEKYILQVTLAP